MALKLFEMFRKSPAKMAAPTPVKREKAKKQEEPVEGFIILSSATIPKEYYCELPLNVRRQLVSRLAGDIPDYNYPNLNHSGRTISTVI